VDVGVDPFAGGGGDFLFENKAPVDVQIQIHIEKLCCPA
jgi:hypothetical protein